MSIIEDFQSELELLFDDLNWTYMLIFIFILYGIKNKEEFEWYNRMMDSRTYLKSFKVWIAGLVVLLTFCLFKYLESGIDASYISQGLRSYIIVIVFNSIFNKKMESVDS
ncbi:MAG TPA: hypothetical protein VMV86_03455 [Methanosarcinales archaeon]|nr:hypothetical protein [Methanosarcinales archaeon]